MTITVSRGGVKSKTWYQTGIEARLSSGDEAVEIRFEIASKGGGDTDVLVRIPQEHWCELIGCMFKGNRPEAMKSIGTALNLNAGYSFLDKLKL